jgi:hypothetical protein
MGLSLSKYRVFCVSENEYIDGWFEELPTVCPHNNTHTIDSNLTTIIGRLEDGITVDASGKAKVHGTTRPDGTMTYFTGRGDDTSNPSNVGGGDLFKIRHTTGEPLTQSIYADFNIAMNQTFIKEGYIIWQHADIDHITLSVVPRVPVYTHVEGANTNFRLYPAGGIIIPAAGNGDVTFTNDILSPIGGLVFMPLTDKGIQPTAFWNAEWDNTTKKYKNLTPAPTGNGQYNIFAAEVTLNRFVNSIPLLGDDGNLRLTSEDCSEIGQGMRFKVTTVTTNDHDWGVSFALTLYRTKTS